MPLVAFPCFCRNEKIKNEGKKNLCEQKPYYLCNVKRQKVKTKVKQKKIQQ